MTLSPDWRSPSQRRPIARKFCIWLRPVTLLLTTNNYFSLISWGYAEIFTDFCVMGIKTSASFIENPLKLLDLGRGTPLLGKKLARGIGCCPDVLFPPEGILMPNPTGLAGGGRGKPLSASCITRGLGGCPSNEKAIGTGPGEVRSSV